MAAAMQWRASESVERSWALRIVAAAPCAGAMMRAREMTVAHREHVQHYVSLALMAALHFAAMYALMYAMVNSFDNVYPNRNQLYMAGIMTAPMVILELLLMRSMYENKTANAAILAVSSVVFIAFFLFIRNQTGIGDTEFLRSMIPHHASAILMCEKAAIRDAEIRQLCVDIVSGQQAEIDQMKAKLAALDG
jgi:hypothetical protein